MKKVCPSSGRKRANLALDSVGFWRKISASEIDENFVVGKYHPFLSFSQIAILFDKYLIQVNIFYSALDARPI